MSTQIQFSCAIIGVPEDADADADFEWMGLRFYSLNLNEKNTVIGDHLAAEFSSSEKGVIRRVLYYKLEDPIVGTVQAIKDRCKPFLVPALAFHSLAGGATSLGGSFQLAKLGIEGDAFNITARKCEFIVMVSWAPLLSVGYDSSIDSLQKPSIPDAAYNYQMQPSPVSIYEPIFGQFVREVDDLVLSPNAYSESEREEACKIVEINSKLHKYDPDRHAALRRSHFPGGESLWSDKRIRINGSSDIRLDGGIRFPLKEFEIEAFSALAELQNGTGEGGCGPEEQCMSDYRTIVLSDDFERLRRVSSCPMFLIALTGTHLIIWGAVTADRFFFQPLTYIITDPKLRPVGCPVDTIMLEVAGVFCTLRKCLDALKTYYEGLSPLPERPATDSSTAARRTSSKSSAGTQKSGPTQSLVNNAPGRFPRWSKFTEDGSTKQYEVTYVRRIVDDFSKPVYLAKAVHKTQEGVEIESKDVVVKFTHRYFPEAHRLLAENGFAPKLLYAALEEFEAGTDAPGMWVVVMEHLKDVSHPDSLSEVQKTKLRDCVKMLHEKKYVHGDLRRPNIFVRGTDELFLIDFDWSGEDGVVTYPMDICMDKAMNWHHGVNCGNTIFQDHDNHRIAKILAIEEY